MTIRSIPAVHGLDGAVSFILEWNGLKFAYSSDTIPNKWWIEHTKGADIAIHECFLPSVLLVTKQGFAPLEGAQRRDAGSHLARAVRQGDVDDEASSRRRLPLLQRLRHAARGDAPRPQDLRRTACVGAGLHGLQRHQGRHSGADVRRSTKRSGPARRSRKRIRPTRRGIPFSDFTKSGVLPLPEVVQPIYDEINELYGTDYEPMFK